MMMGPGKDNRILLHASSPLMPGMFTSISIRAGRKEFTKIWLLWICFWAGHLLPTKCAESKSAHKV
jgi:hypothetical protein